MLFLEVSKQDYLVWEHVSSYVPFYVICSFAAFVVSNSGIVTPLGYSYYTASRVEVCF